MPQLRYEYGCGDELGGFFAGACIDDEQRNDVPVAAPHSSWATSAACVIALVAIGSADEISTFIGIDDEQHTTHVTRQSWRAVTHLDNEAWLPLTYFAIDEKYDWQAQTTKLAWAARPQCDDEIGTQLSNFKADDEWNWTKQTTLQAWSAYPYRDDEIGSQLKLISIDEEHSWPDLRQVIPWNASPQRDDEILWPLVNIAVESDATVLGPQKIPWQATIFTDDEAFVPRTYWDGDEAFVGLREYILWNARTFADDEIGSQLAYVADESSTAKTHVELRTRLTWQAITHLDDEALPGAVNELDDEYSCYAQGRTRQTWAAHWTEDDEVGARLYYPIDEDGQYPVVYWSKRSLSAELVDSSDQLPARLSEDYYTTGQIRQSRPPARTETHDEILAVFGLDQEEYWTSVRERIHWYPFAYRDDEIGSQLVAYETIDLISHISSTIDFISHF